MIDISHDMTKLIKECNCSPTYAFFMCMRMRGMAGGFETPSSHSKSKEVRRRNKPWQSSTMDTE